MNPETLKTLRERPEFRELLVYLATEAEKVNTFDGMDEITSFTERAYEAGVRLRTKQRLDAILGGLIHSLEPIGGTDPAEYAV